MSRLNPPPAVLEIAARLERAGHEAWCVGGAVRDALLGQPHLDWDLATSATPEAVREIFGRRRTIPVGVEFGTVGVLDEGGTLHEVTTFRRDVRTDGRHAVVEFGASLDEDLARRDFTINAIAYSPRRDELRDPFGGRADLERRLVRAVGDPDDRMREDRLRALRAIRFAARFDFAIEPETLGAIERSAAHLGRLSPERVKQELEKTMEQIARPSRAIARWKSTGAFATLVPSLADVDARTVAALDCLAMPGLARRPQRQGTRLAALFAGCTGAQAAAALTALRFSKQQTSWIAGLVERWRTVGAVMEHALRAGLRIADADVRRWVAGIGRLDLPAFMRLASAQWSARRAAGEPAPSARAVRTLYRRLLRARFDAVALRDLAVTGDDLRRAGIPAGPILGKILQALLDWVLEDPARNGPDQLLQEATRRYEQCTRDAGGPRGPTTTR